MRLLNHILSLLLVVVLLMAVAVRRDKVLMGFKVESGVQKPKTMIDAEGLAKLHLQLGDLKEISPYIWKEKSGRVIYGSIPYGKNILGYCGPTPVYIVVKGDRIEQVVPGRNCESNEFFSTLYDKHFFDRWKNMTLSEAAASQVDAVSGATHSSTAVAKTVNVTAEEVTQLTLDSKRQGTPMSAQNVIAVTLLLLGVVVAFFKEGKFWHLLQLLLNVAILGFWCGSYLSMSLFVNWLSHGVHPLQGIVVFVMLLLAILIPLFTKRKNYYCSYVCPFGAAQELVGMLGFHRWKLSMRMMHYLSYTRRIILLVIVLLMLTGVTFEVMNYEVFSMFLFDKAGTEIYVLGGCFLLLSLFMERPYCNFVCPTGQLLSWSQGVDLKIKKGKEK